MELQQLLREVVTICSDSKLISRVVQPARPQVTARQQQFRNLRTTTDLRPGGGGRKLAEAHRTFSAENCKEEKS